MGTDITHVSNHNITTDVLLLRKIRASGLKLGPINSEVIMAGCTSREAAEHAGYTSINLVTPSIRRIVSG